MAAVSNYTFQTPVDLFITKSKKERFVSLNDALRATRPGSSKILKNVGLIVQRLVEEKQIERAINCFTRLDADRRLKAISQIAQTAILEAAPYLRAMKHHLDLIEIPETEKKREVNLLFKEGIVTLAQSYISKWMFVEALDLREIYCDGRDIATIQHDSQRFETLIQEGLKEKVNKFLEIRNYQKIFELKQKISKMSSISPRQKADLDAYIEEAMSRRLDELLPILLALKMGDSSTCFSREILEEMVTLLIRAPEEKITREVIHSMSWAGTVIGYSLYFTGYHDWSNRAYSIECKNGWTEE